MSRKIDTIKEDILKFADSLEKYEGLLTEEDKSFKQFFRYILGKEGIYKPLEPQIIDSKDKVCILCMKKYIHIINELLKVDYEKRRKLYSTKVEEIQDPSIKEELNQLKFLFGKKINNTISHQYQKERESIFSSLKEILFLQRPSLFFYPDNFQIYFYHFFQEPDVLKFIFFKIYRTKYNFYFRGIDLQHYYANFNDKFCLDLVILFFNLKKQTDNNILYLVFLPLIFNFNVLFSMNYKINIDKKDLEKIINKVYKETDNLTKTKVKITVNNIYQIFYRNFNRVIYTSDDKNDKENQIKINNDKDKYRDSLDSTSEQSKAGEDVGNSNKNNKDEKQENKIDPVQNDIKEEETNYKIDAQNNEDIKQIIELMQKNFNNQISNLKNQMGNMQEQIEKLNVEIIDLKHDLNRIQIRDKIKAFLSSFYYLLSNDDKEEIKNYPERRGKIIKQAFAKHYKDYENSTKFKMILELIEKVANLYNLGNAFAHNLDSRNYKEVINAFKKKII